MGATVVATILVLSALPAGAEPVAAAEDSAGASLTEEVTGTNAASRVVAIIATRERPPSATCDDPDVVSLELYDPETGLSDVVVSNETDCSAGVSRVRTSPDRSMITYQEPGPSTSILELETGTVVRSIHDCGNAEWNPDGSLLACRELAGSVKIIVVETGSNVNSLRLPGESPADAFDWVGPTELLATSAGNGSPCVVPSHLGPRRSALWRIEIAEPTFTRLVDSPCDTPYGEIQVSADRDAIAFVSGGDLYVAAIDGSSPARVALDGSGTHVRGVRTVTWATSGDQLMALTEVATQPAGANIVTRLELIDATSGVRSVTATFGRNVTYISDAAPAIGDDVGPIGSDVGPSTSETPDVSTGDQGQETVDIDTEPDVDADVAGSTDDDGGPLGVENPDDSTEIPNQPDLTTNTETDADPATVPDPNTDPGEDPGPTSDPNTDPGEDPGPTSDPTAVPTPGSDADPDPGTEPSSTTDSEDGSVGMADPVAASDPGDPSPDQQDSPVVVTATDGVPITILATSTEPVVVNELGDDPSDQEAPILTFTGVKASYAADEVLRIECAVVDSGSGVDTSTCDSLTGKSYLFRGTNTLIGKATDLAGNSTEVTLIVTIDVTAAELASALTQVISEVPEVSVALAPLVGQLTAGNCGPSFQTFGARTRELATDGTISGATSIQIYSLGIAVCRG